MEETENKFIHVYIIDENGFEIDSKIINEIDFEQSRMVKEFKPNVLIKGKWDGEKWIEGATQEEKNEREAIERLNALQPSTGELEDAKIEIKILTLLTELEMI